MKKLNRLVRPTGLKGRAINERMIQLMDIKTINEDKKTSKIELTKKGPDGKAYAIVRENHEYYIKVADKTEGLVFEDFHYIGGLMNKKDFAYSSYSKATTQLNLKFKSLNEAYGVSENINVLRDDNLLEHDNTTMTNYGKVDSQEYVEDKKGKELEYNATEDKENSGDNLADGKVANDDEKVSVSESEAEIDRMITGEAEPTSEPEKEYSLVRALAEADEDESDDSIESILENLSDADKTALFEALKKKVQ